MSDAAKEKQKEARADTDTKGRRGRKRKGRDRSKTKSNGDVREEDDIVKMFEEAATDPSKIRSSNYVQSLIRKLEIVKENAESKSSDTKGKRRKRNVPDDSDPSAEKDYDDASSTGAVISSDTYEKAKCGDGDAVTTLRRNFEERYLDVVRSLYFRGGSSTSSIRANSEGSTSADGDMKFLEFLLPQSGFLASNLRIANPFERWSPIEIAQFESGLQCFGKKFARISAIIPSKTTREVVEFYYTWKKTSHYADWKRNYTPLV